MITKPSGRPRCDARFGYGTWSAPGLLRRHRQRDGAHRRGRSLAERLGLAAPVSGEQLYVAIGVAAHWPGPIAVASLGLVHALHDGDYDGLARHARDLRLLFNEHDFDHDATRVLAGLAIMKAERLLMPLLGLTPAQWRRLRGQRVAEAKRVGAFPWHLLDG